MELFDLHRFEDDPQWGETLSRNRKNTDTPHDIDAIDKCVDSK